MGAYIYPPSSGARGLQRFICLKYYKAQEWESPFQYNILFETYKSLESSSTTPGGDRYVQPVTFFIKFVAQ